ncbi:MAG: endonuclease MutS2, partial [Turicibacter sp.]|nr:endonuclease MutS2 [Turicibacter sp.]
MKQAIQILEFNKIKQIVDSLCACSLGQKRVEYLSPSIEEKQVEYSLNQSDEALKIILALGEAPLGGVSDITEAIKRAKISAMLSAQELLGISRLLYAVSQLKGFAERLNEIKVETPIFSSQVNSLVSLNSLQTAINDCIDETGYVLDSASFELRSIRRSIQSTEARIKEKLNHVVSERRNKLTDGIVTIRNERYVVPVRAEAKNTFGGTIHDQSSTGNTYFIEPKEVVDLNNKLQEYHVEERREIERILRALTDEVKKFVDALSVNVEVLGEIDFMFAKGKYARLINGTRPKMNTKGIIRLVAARHPLIDPKKVVPNDIELGDEYTTIVITGPNTGGKTVTLKTVGLLTLMAQAGLLIPAHETSQLAIFDHVFADIGDEQSIEQSLSTFSSHMTNIVRIMERLTVNSLILFDELGAGTDPKEGASLAISILDYVKVRGARTIATSHYPELKAYAYENDDVINASVEFNIETLSPTYRLLVGVPGRSNAFEISKRLGLKEAILTTARAYVETERTEMTDLITKLEDRGLELDQEIQLLQKQNQEVEEMKLDYERKIAKFEAERE